MAGFSVELQRFGGSPPLEEWERSSRSEVFDSSRPHTHDSPANSSRPETMGASGVARPSDQPSRVESPDGIGPSRVPGDKAAREVGFEQPLRVLAGIWGWRVPSLPISARHFAGGRGAVEGLAASRFGGP